jgi:cardiolipin-specific phospholipase
VDWRGCGASERPAFSAASPGEAEQWFLAPLHSWLGRQGLLEEGQSLSIMGHSLGGYLAAVYAVQQAASGGGTGRQPPALANLILVSPAGLPEPPAAAELQQRHSAHWLLQLLSRGWEAGLTPQAVARALGPFGASAVRALAERRYGHMLRRQAQQALQQGQGLPPPQCPVPAASSLRPSAGAGAGAGAGSAQAAAAASAALAAAAAQAPAAGACSEPPPDEAAFADYFSALTMGAGSGEHCLSVLLSFGAHARQPFGPRLLAAARQRLWPVPPGPPAITLLYGGSHDWMDAGAGKARAARLRAEGLSAHCSLVPGAGHNLFLEQPEAFAALLAARLGPQRAGGLGAAQHRAAL